MSTPATLKTLQQTKAAIQEIHKQLKPFLSRLQDDTDAHLKVQAQAAVALSIGTLRYMGARLKGNDVKADDPLRQELNHIRKILVDIETKGKALSAKKKKKNNKTPQKTGEANVPSGPVRIKHQSNADVVTAGDKAAPEVVAGDKRSSPCIAPSEKSQKRQKRLI
jgi:hypothetical protein